MKLSHGSARKQSSKVVSSEVNTEFIADSTDTYSWLRNSPVFMSYIC